MDPFGHAGHAILAVGDRIHADWLPAAACTFADRENAALVLGRAAPDLLVVDVDAWSPELAEALQSPLHDRMGLVLVVDDDQADAVGALLGHRIDAFLDPAGDRFSGRQLLEGLLRQRKGHAGVSDVGLTAPVEGPLELLRRDAERVALALAELAANRPVDAPAPRPVTAARIRAHIKARRLRERFFAPDLFADPAWDMILDLAAARLEQRPVAVSSLCIAAAVPTTTALRWIKTMMDRGMLERRADPTDARRAFIELGKDTAVAVDTCLDAMLNLPGQ